MRLRYFHFMESYVSESQSSFLRLECFWYDVTVWRVLAAAPSLWGQYQAYVIRNPKRRQGDSQTHPSQQPSSHSLLDGCHRILEQEETLYVTTSPPSGSNWTFEHHEDQNPTLLF